MSEALETHPEQAPSGDEPTTGAGSRRLRELLIAAGALLVLALGMRLTAIGQETLWADEFYSLQTAGQSTLSDVVAYTRTHDPYPPLYFMILHAWMEAVGDGDVSVRIPSVLAGAAAVLMMLPLGLAIWPQARFRTLLAAAMATFSPYLIYYSQEARGYTLLLLFEMLALWGLTWSWSHDPATAGPRRFWIPLAGVAGALLCVATHHFGFFVWGWAVAVTCLLLLSRRKSRPWPEAVLLVALVAGAAPFVPALLEHRASGHGIAWLPKTMAASDLFEIFAAQVCGPVNAAVPAALAMASVGLFVIVLAAVSVASMRRVATGKDLGGELPLLLAGTVLFAAPVVLSYLTSPVIWHGQRYLIVAVPVLLLLFAGGIESRLLRPAVAAAFAVMLVCSAYYLNDYYSYRQKRSWDVAAEEIDEAAQPGDAIAVIPERLTGLLQRYMKTKPPALKDTDLLQPDAPRRVWLLATGNLKTEIEARTAYRVLGVRELKAHSAARLYLHELIRMDRVHRASLGS